MDKHDTAYITQAPPQNNNNLRSYVSSLNSKLDYARWKQDLILSYNYMPLANIKQKLQIDYALYLKKMQSQQAKLRAAIENEEIITLLNNLSRYKSKLLENAEQTEMKIQTQRVLVKKLRQQANSKKEMLKSIMRNTKQKIREDLQSNGIQSARDLRSTKRSISTLSKIGSLTTRNPRGSIPDITHVAKQPPLASLYNNCVMSLSKESQKREHNMIKKKKQMRKQSNQFLVSSQIKKQNEVKWEQFKKLQFDEIIKIINQKDPTRERLKKLLVAD